MKNTNLKNSMLLSAGLLIGAVSEASAQDQKPYGIRQNGTLRAVVVPWDNTPCPYRYTTTQYKTDGITVTPTDSLVRGTVFLGTTPISGDVTVIEPVAPSTVAGQPARVAAVKLDPKAKLVEFMGEIADKIVNCEKIEFVEKEEKPVDQQSNKARLMLQDGAFKVFYGTTGALFEVNKLLKVCAVFP
jgi:hypothetical protein